MEIEGKLTYSVPVTEAKSGETAVYRAATHKDVLLTELGPGLNTSQAIFLSNIEKNPKNNFLGSRPRKEDGTLEEKYTWETYEEVHEIATALGSGMVNLGLTQEKAQYKNYKIKFISIYAMNTREWIITDIANSLYNHTTMPIYDTLGEEATEFMFKETELSTVFLTCNHVAGISDRASKGKLPFLRNLVVMDEWMLNSELEAKVKSAKLKLLKFTEVIANGRANKQDFATVTPDDICFFSYTSGTTGTPKGAMVSHRNVAAAVAGAAEVIPIKSDILHISYLPLAHVFERVIQLYVMSVGGRYGMFGGDVFKLRDDLAILKPNIFVSVPRLFNKFFDKIKAKLEAATGIKGCLASKGVASKLATENKNGAYTHWFYDKIIFSKTKAFLGGNVKFMLTGSAPISPEVMKYMKIVMCCPFVMGYGQTEGLAGSFLPALDDPTVGHVGAPLPHNEYKLIDVPDMKYFSTDKDEDGNPAPRGEILVRGGNVVPGYYKNDAKTAEAIDSDGWLHSGDIGTIMFSHKGLKITDRRKNIFKLSQGEYVAPDKLEQAYKTTKAVEDIFVYGDSLKSALVAIVNVDKDEAEHLAKEAGIPWKNNYAEVVSDEKVNAIILKRLEETKKHLKLKGFERVKKLFIDPTIFADHGLLTTTFKLKRNVAKDFYLKKIDELYQGIN